MNRHLLLRLVISLGLVVLSVIACGAFPPASTSIPIPSTAATAPTITPVPPTAVPITEPLASLTPSVESETRIEFVGVPPAGQLYHSVYPGGVTGEEDDITLDDVLSYEQAVGKSATWVYFSHHWYRDRRFPMETVTWIRDAGSIPYIRLMMRSDAVQGDAEPTFTLDRLIHGDFDDDLYAWASDARDFGSPLIAEFGTEVNGEWFSWNGVWNGGGALDEYGDPNEPDGPERFRDAYRYIVGIARDEGAHNIVWVFHVNNADVPGEDWNRFENYYPGDDWIDWIGVSVYGAGTPFDDEWPSFRDEMDAVYPRLAALSPDKPIVLLEFGVAARNPLGDQAEWAEAALTDLTRQRWPRIIGFSWWNEYWQNDDNPEHDTTMRVQDNPQLADVFRRLVGENEAVLGRAVLTEMLVPTASASAVAPQPLSLAKVRYWLYLIDVDLEPETVALIENSAYDLVVLDFIPSEVNNTDYPLADVIAHLHNAPQPKLVLAYIDIGQAENYRTYWQPGWGIGNPDWIAGTDPDGWEGNFPVVFWRDEWKAIWLGSGGYLQSIMDAGFDGVYLDWVEAYSDDSVIAIAEQDGVDARQEMIRWVSDIAEFTRARRHGFIVIGQNAAELAEFDDYIAVIDAIAQEQVWFDGAADNDPPGDCPLPRTEADVDTPTYYESLSPSCQEQYDQYPDSTLHVSSEMYLRDLQLAQSKGLIIFTVDYALDPNNVAWVYQTSRALGFVPFVGSRALDQYVEVFK